MEFKPRQYQTVPELIANDVGFSLQNRISMAKEMAEINQLAETKDVFTKEEIRQALGLKE